MKKSPILQNLPPELQLYADRYLGKLPINSEKASFSCTQHPRNGKVKTTLGGMKNGFLCPAGVGKSDHHSSNSSKLNIENPASAHGTVRV